jgi:hypothetical protein
MDAMTLRQTKGQVEAPRNNHNNHNGKYGSEVGCGECWRQHLLSLAMMEAAA